MLIAAEAREFNGLIRFCRDLQPVAWPVRWARRGWLGDQEVSLAANGAGPKRAAGAMDAAKSAGQMDLVCSMGFCGALDGSLSVGDIFVADSVRAGGHSFPAARPQATRAHASGAVASVDHVAQSAEEKSRLRATGAGVVEMEAAGVAERAAAWGVPFYCVRSVTDLATETFALDFNAALRPDGSFDAMHLVASALLRPAKRFPELLRLQQRCRTASTTLGEFIADCRF